MEIEPNRLGICPKCTEIINLNDIKEIRNGAIIGCGLAENDFMRCDNCLCIYDDDECRRIRCINRLSLTAAREITEE